MSNTSAFYQTKDVILREISADDAERIVRWRSDPAVYQYFKMPRKITVEEHLQWFAHSYCLNSDRRDFIVFSHSGEPLGTVGVQWNKEERTAEVSYLIDPEYRGHGWASKALYALCLYAKQQWKANVFVACVHKANLPSQRFIESQGFIFVKNEDDFAIYQKNF